MDPQNTNKRNGTKFNNHNLWTWTFEPVEVNIFVIQDMG